jgi:chitodextrinase
MKKINIVLAGAFVLTSIFVMGRMAHAQQAGANGPTIPVGLSAAVNQSNQVFISWGASTETSTPVVGYYLYRNGMQIANTPGNTFYTDNVPGGIYAYTVTAYDGNGNVSAQSVSSGNVTVLPDYIAPTVPTGLVVTPSSSSISLSWNASTDNFAVIGYYIYRNGEMINNTTTISGTTYLDSGLSEGASYTYAVVAYDAVGNISNRTTPVMAKTIFDVLLPSAPQGLSAKAISPTEIDLSWQPATDNVKVAGYLIYQNGVQLVDTGSVSTTYASTGLSAGTTYGYGVYAYDEVRNVSLQGPQAGASTFPPDLTPPSIPKNLYASALSSSEIVLTWETSSDNVGVAGYNVYNGSTKIGSTASTTYTDTNLATSTTYQYFVAAYDASGNISPQTSVAVTTLSSSPASTPPITLNLGVPSSTAGQPSTPVAPIITTLSATGLNNFTVNLYYGSRGTNVLALQAFLIQQGDLASNYGTGFYGSFTVKAVQKLQCVQNIVCSGGMYTTGWGSFGPKSRRIVNAL